MPINLSNFRSVLRIRFHSRTSRHSTTLASFIYVFSSFSGETRNSFCASIKSFSAPNYFHFLPPFSRLSADDNSSRRKKRNPVGSLISVCENPRRIIKGKKNLNENQEEGKEREIRALNFTAIDPKTEAICVALRQKSDFHAANARTTTRCFHPFLIFLFAFFSKNTSQTAFPRSFSLFLRLIADGKGCSGTCIYCRRRWLFVIRIRMEKCRALLFFCGGPTERGKRGGKKKRGGGVEMEGEGGVI